MSVKHLFKNSFFNWLLISAIVVSLIVGNLVLALRTVDDLSLTQKSLYNSSKIITALDDLHIVVLSAETGQRGYLITEIEAYLEPYQEALDQVSDHMVFVSALESELPQQRKRIMNLIQLVGEKLDQLKQTVGLVHAKHEKEALSLMLSGEVRNLYQEIRREFMQIEALEVQHRNQLYDQLNKVEKEARVTFIISGVTSALLLIGLAILGRINLRIQDNYREELERQNAELAEKVAQRTEELTLYSEELARSNRELEDFAFVASHDLQEPLRKIRAFGDRLESRYMAVLDETGADYLSRMRNAAERMSHLINDLLEFSRIATRGKPFVAVSLDTVISRIVDDLEISIDESQTKLQVDPLPEVKADPSQMNQLFLNLLSNAIKFRHPDVAPVITVKYEALERDDEVWHRITIQDNGIGFDQQFADKIFTPFQRLHARAEYAGTGIGLAVCRRIVERHGGVIRATSEPGKGAVFIIELPDEPPTAMNDGENADVI